MKVIVQVESDDDTPAVVQEVFRIERGALGVDSLGSKLAEAKDVLAAVAAMVDEQVKAESAADLGLPGLRDRA